MRGLKQNFFNDLKTGTLHSLLELIKIDNTLDLQIRNNYINIYYRGGNILDVSLKKSIGYQFHFNPKYLKNTSPAMEISIKAYKASHDWGNFIPLAKQAMDFYFTKNKKQEREYQQLVIRENNYSSIANGTDYFILDIEYTFPPNARFDLIAVEWPSIASIRKLSKNYKPKLVVFEMKYADGALAGTASINKHISDFNNLINNPIKAEDFKKEMVEVFKQKRELGVIPCLSGIGKTNANAVTEFADNIEMIFIIANHDPASTRLKNELSKVTAPQIKFITSNFMGYGLYNEGAFKFTDFVTQYKKQI